MNIIKRLLTREVEMTYFSDGDVFVKGQEPAKPKGIVAQTIRPRVWRWKRLGR